ncbi:hypothetical protein ABIB40_002937 [Pedobacter sp. UYP30]|uniref:DUF4133 domain-containing protein n=1 Tax=Pedobacter sp. UYP30 TaxID=1756400 RepID=UPI0033993BF0
MASIYQINKGINKPIEFKGLKAQYISYLAIGLVVLLVLFATMYIIGLNLLLCIGIIVLCGSVLFIKVYALSHKYGEYGLLKKAAKRYIPNFIRFKSRKIFLHLSSSYQTKKEGGSNG